jgi:YfiH family protein
MYKSNGLSIFFGNAQTAVFPEYNRSLWQQSDHLLNHPTFNFLQKNLDIYNLIFAHQIHGTNILDVSSENNHIQSFIHEADALCTNTLNTGLAVLTADCVPVILYNSSIPLIAIIHAGWRGALDTIVPKTLDYLCNTYSSKVKDYKVFFGPCARACCYIIDHNLADFFAQTKEGRKAIIQKNSDYFLDIPTYLIQQLMDRGILTSSIHSMHAQCTICNTNFCSYRRQKQAAGRQITAVSIQKDF